jgi:hypothetical protein
VPGDPSLGTRLSDYLVAVQSALCNDTPMRPEIVSSASASPRLRRTFSNAGSMDSSVSAQSSQSWKSHMSLDSRDPRQGRRRLNALTIQTTSTTTTTQIRRKTASSTAPRHLATQLFCIAPIGSVTKKHFITVRTTGYAVPKVRIETLCFKCASSVGSPTYRSATLRSNTLPSVPPVINRLGNSCVKISYINTSSESTKSLGLYAKPASIFGRLLIQRCYPLHYVADFVA